MAARLSNCWKASAARLGRRAWPGPWKTQTDPKTGVVIFHHGGTYTLKGSDYVETVEYATPSTKDLIGQTAKFTLKIEGDTLNLIGVDNPWREIWKRTANTNADAARVDPATTAPVVGGSADHSALGAQEPPRIMA